MAEGQKRIVQRPKRIGGRPKRLWLKAKKALAEGQNPPQELEVRPRSGLYLLVYKYRDNSLEVKKVPCETYILLLFVVTPPDMVRAFGLLLQ